VTDLAFGIRLKADGSGQVVGQLGAIEKAHRGIKAASEELKTSLKGTSDATNTLASTAKAEGAALDAAARAAIGKQDAMRGLGKEIGQVVRQFANGAGPAEIFKNTITQAGGASEGAGGKIGALSTLMRGPWGAAIDAVTIGLGFLISGLLDTGEQAKKTGDAVDIHKMSLEELTKAIEDENKALKNSIETGKDAEQQALRTAFSHRETLIGRRKNIVAILDEAVALEKRARAERGQFGDDSSGAVGTLLAGRKVSRLEQQLAEANKSLTLAQENLNLARIPVLRREAEARVDPKKALDKRFEDTIGALNKKFEKGVLTGAAYTTAIEAAEAQREKETKALQEVNRKPRAAKAPAFEIVTPTEVSEILRRTFGATITDTLRPSNASYGAKNSYHKIGQAVDFVPRGGMGAITKAQIRAALFGEGIDLKELLGPGDKGHSDHFHAAFGRRRLGSDQVAARNAREEAAILREQAEQAAAAAREIAGLKSDYEALVRPLDPLISAQNIFLDQLERIDRLSRAGRLGGSLLDLGGEAGTLLGSEGVELALKAAQELADIRGKANAGIMDRIAPNHAEEFRNVIDRAADDLEKRGPNFGREAGLRLSEHMLSAANAVGEAIGGSLGRGIGALGQLLADEQRARSGTYQAGDNARGSYATGAIIATKLQDLVGSLDDTFGTKGDPNRSSFLKSLGKTIGKAGDGAARGDQVASVVKALGFGKFSRTGSQIGGAVGSFVPIPFGREIGSIVGGTIGSFVKKTKSASATITSVDGDASVGGSSSLRGAASGLAGSVQQSLAQVIEALGGKAGGFNVSIGTRKNQFVVDETGQGRTKGVAAQQWFKTEAEAVSFAVMDAIRDGAVTGLSAAVQSALRSSSDIDKALREALKVQDLETMLSGIEGSMGKAFRDFEIQATERKRIASRYGFDIVKLEERTAKDRAKMFEDILGSRIGSLKSLLDDLSFGDLFEGSLSDQRQKLLVEISKAETDAKAGADGAADKVAQLRRRLLDLSRDAFGTAGGELAADRASTRTAAEEIMKFETDRLKAAQDAALGTKVAVEKSNQLLDENNDILAKIEHGIRRIGTSGGGGGSGGGFNFEFSTGRVVEL
jgi:hypothetical protein